MENSVTQEEDVWYLQNMSTRIPLPEPTASDNRELLDNYFFQLAYHQFQFQSGGSTNDIARTLILYRDIPRLLANEGAKLVVDLDADFRKITGMSIETFLWTGFFLYTKVVNFPVFDDSFAERSLNCLLHGLRLTVCIGLCTLP